MMLPNAIQTVRRGLQAAGFFVEADYEFLGSLSANSRPHVFRLDLAAFLQPDRRDMSTIAVVAQGFPYKPAENPFETASRFLSPSFQLSVFGDEIQWWAPTDAFQPIRVTHISEIELDFVRFRVQPDEIRRSKAQFQQSLFSMLPDALSYARDATSKLVIQRFNDALDVVIKNNGISRLTAIGLDLLAALILDDKRLEIGRYKVNSNAIGAIDALDRARKYFPSSFNDIPEVPLDILDTFWQYLRTDMSYRSMTPDDLSDLLSALYESVLLDPVRRRVQGSYFTPRSLAQKILEHMPIEEVAPEERIILDGACGSGNLLRAAEKRLRDLLTPNLTAHEKVEYLSNRIIGVDLDEFAVNIARKSLLLANTPYDREWLIHKGDFLGTQISRQPSIIIANPPFKGASSRGGGERAIQFFTRYLEVLQPGGLMGIILPLALLQNSAESYFRRDLLEYCDILELWMLPKQSIPSSSANIAVLILRKYAEKARKTNWLSRIYVAHNTKSVNRFVQGEAVSLSFETEIGSGLDHSSRIIPSILDNLWSRLRKKFRPICAHGFQVLNGVQGDAEQFSPTPIIGWRACLSFTTAIEPYNITWDRQESQLFVNYPGNLRYPREESHFTIPKKLVIQGESGPTNPWRLITAIDNKQLVIKESFHYILPIEYGLSLEVLSAILNSQIANAWYSEHDLQFHVQNTLIEQLPLPDLTESQQKRLEKGALTIAILKNDLSSRRSEENISSYEKIREELDKIDNLLFEAYGLSVDEILLVNQLMQRGRRPGHEWKHTKVNPVPLISLSFNGEIYRAIGDIVEVNVAERSMILDMPGISRSLLKCKIPPAMPGWALQSRIPFEASISMQELHRIYRIVQMAEQSNKTQGIISAGNIDLFDITPSRTSYLNDDELWAYTSARSEL
jgi:predicted RNA methylase